MSLNRAEISGDEAVFRLRDYLVPGGRYPYKDLAGDLENALSSGYTVYLYSVPGFMMLAGHPLEPWETCPWHVCDSSSDKWFKTAKEALSY